MSAGAAGAGPALVLVAALARNRAIGRDNALPWHISADLKRFKALTLGKPVLMGRKTFDSIGRALPGRTTLVLTRNSDWSAEGCTTVTSLQAAIDACPGETLMVCGGAAVYELALDRAAELWLTRVDAEVGGDTAFPAVEWDRFRLESRVERPADDRNAYDLVFEDWVRREP